MFFPQKGLNQLSKTELAPGQNSAIYEQNASKLSSISVEI